MSVPLMTDRLINYVERRHRLNRAIHTALRLQSRFMDKTHFSPLPDYMVRRLTLLTEAFHAVRS